MASAFSARQRVPQQRADEKLGDVFHWQRPNRAGVRVAALAVAAEETVRADAQLEQVGTRTLNTHSRPSRDALPAFTGKRAAGVQRNRGWHVTLFAVSLRAVGDARRRGT